jgi:hypothetical protein
MVYHSTMLKPQKPWPFTGRFYPKRAELRVIHLPKGDWADLVWFDPARKVNVYLSTLPLDKVEKADTIHL